MGLLDLPLEVLEIIVEYLVATTTLRGGFRVREVNSKASRCGWIPLRTHSDCIGRAFCTAGRARVHEASSGHVLLAEEACDGEEARALALWETSPVGSRFVRENQKWDFGAEACLVGRFMLESSESGGSAYGDARASICGY